MSMDSAGARNADGSAVKLSKEARKALDAKKEAQDIASAIEHIVTTHNMHTEMLKDLLNTVLNLGERVTLLEKRQNPEEHNPSLPTLN